MDSAKDGDGSKSQSASSPKPAKSASIPKSPPKTPTSAVSRGSARGTAAAKEPSPSRGSNRPQTNAKASARSTKKEEPSLMGADTKTEEVKPLPEGCMSIFLTTASQRIFDVVGGEHVTDASPFKLISKEEIFKDFYNRAGVSDFSVVKDLIKSYPGDEILLVYDPDFKYGNNFYMATTEEAKQLLLNPPATEEEVVKEEVIHRYKPPTPRPWVCLGSDKEILAEKVVESRPRIQVSFLRPRKSFGAPVKLSSRSSNEIKMGYVELPAYEDKSFGVQVMELDTYVHNTPLNKDVGCQTEWKYPKNAHTQYQPLAITAEELANVEGNQSFINSLTKIEPFFRSSLLDNEIMDFLFDDYFNLSEGDNAFTSRVDNTLKEFQSFTDLQFSKDKAITCIQWHPTISTVIGMSVADKMDFDTRSKNQAKITLLPSYIVLWSFVDPIQPQLLLEAPDDVYAFQFRPSDPHIVAGGCASGQIVLWDIERYMDSLQNVKAKLKSRNNMAALPGFDDDADKKIPIMRYAALSAIEGGHTSIITDLQWVPDHFEINRMGYSLENKAGKNVQLMTSSIDHCIYFWDIRNPKTPQGDQLLSAPSIPAISNSGFVDSLGGGSVQEDATQPAKNISNIPDTFKYLDLTWKPLLKVHLYKSEPGGDHAPTKFSIHEVQGDRSVLETLNSKDNNNQPAAAAGGAGGKARTIQKIKTHFYVGSEDGELIYVDWMPQKDQDTGKIQTPKPEFYSTHHDGLISSLERCPFDRSLLLVVGGWRWSLWREKVNSGPLLKSCTDQKPLTGGAWSPTRPAVFFITRADGVLEIWDLLDKTHTPTLTQPISSAPLSYISPWVVGKHQLLAIGDLSGTLRVLKVPYRLRSASPNEKVSIGQYIELETRRRKFVVDRWNMREQEKIEQEQEAKRKAGIAPQVTLSEEEQIAKMRFEYDAYLSDETAYLRSMGMKDDDDLPAS